jgi:hypothetical protein
MILAYADNVVANTHRRQAESRDAEVQNNQGNVLAHCAETSRIKEGK